VNIFKDAAKILSNPKLTGSIESTASHKSSSICFSSLTDQDITEPELFLFNDSFDVNYLFKLRKRCTSTTSNKNNSTTYDVLNGSDSSLSNGFNKLLFARKSEHKRSSESSSHSTIDYKYDEQQYELEQMEISNLLNNYKSDDELNEFFLNMTNDFCDNDREIARTRTTSECKSTYNLNSRSNSLTVSATSCCEHMIEYEDYESQSDHSFCLQSNSTQTLPSQHGHFIQLEIDLENLNCSKNRLNRKRLSCSECKLNLGESTNKMLSRRVRRQRRALNNKPRRRSITGTSSTQMLNKRSDLKYKPSFKVEKLLNDSRGMRKYLLDYDSIMSFSKHQTINNMHSRSSFSSNWELNDIEMFLNSTPITSSRHILPNLSREANTCQNATLLQNENRSLCSPILSYDRENMNGILSLDSNLIKSIRFIDSSSTQEDEEDIELILKSTKQKYQQEHDEEDTILHSCNINNSIGVQSSNRCSSGYLSDF